MIDWDGLVESVSFVGDFKLYYERVLLYCMGSKHSQMLHNILLFCVRLMFQRGYCERIRLLLIRLERFDLNILITLVFIRCITIVVLN